jgi:hypothetical protein
MQLASRWCAAGFLIAALGWLTATSPGGAPSPQPSPARHCTALALDRTSGETRADPCPSAASVWLEAFLGAPASRA